MTTVFEVRLGNKKREIVCARVMGFCAGVRRALSIVDEELSGSKGAPIYTLGDLVHNNQVTGDLAKKGVRTIGPEDEISGGTVVVRAHGAGPDVIEHLSLNGTKIVDATCPTVRRSHKIIENHNAEGYYVIIAGERNHSEVQGMAARASSCRIVQNTSEIELQEYHAPLMVIAQTTFDREEFLRICNLLKKHNPSTKIFNTICPATDKRVEALEELADQVEALIVIGGSHSANTRRLFEAACKTGRPSWHVEDVEDLDSEIYKYRKIGITAGASTPDWIIEKIKLHLETTETGRI
jgi:4-hydroxy-3-methylbut-2-en-1-yl diphosphate reductase